MPVLETPEVIIEERLSGFTTYYQVPLSELPDMDLMEEATDSSGHLGLNPVINNASLMILPVQGAGNSDVTLKLSLRESWAGKDHILEEIANLNLPLYPEPRSSWSTKDDVLVLQGAKEILQLGDYLRDKFEKSTRDDKAVYFRPIIHPALLGTIMDAVEQAIVPKTNDSSWHRAFLEYGWRL